MQKRWVTKPEGDRESVLKMSELLGIDRYLSELLVQRGITTFENAKTFFRPNLNQLHDPFRMKDMDRAISRTQLIIAFCALKPSATPASSRQRAANKRGPIDFIQGRG